MRALGGFWIRGRAVWHAKPPKDTPTRADWTHTTRKTIVHHSAGAWPENASQESERAHMREIQRFHQHDRGWNDIGYNYVIFPSGRVYEGRGFETRGAHSPERNEHPGVCFVGDYTVQEPTRKSLRALRKLESRLKWKGARLKGREPHSASFATSCPGTHLAKALGL